jgi:hypothetical protein
MSLLPAPIPPAPTRDVTAALYEVRRAFYHWHHNGFNAQGCEHLVAALIDNLDRVLDAAEPDGLRWDAAFACVRVALDDLGYIVPPGPAHTFGALVHTQIDYLAKRGVL